MSQALDYHTIYRRNLPHIQPPGATFFVTFRLANSLPVATLQRWHEEDQTAEPQLARLPEGERREECYRQQKRAFGCFDEELDRAEFGPTWLGETAVAQLVYDALRQRDGAVYNLMAFTIMPNHVHAVFTPCARNDGVVGVAAHPV